MFRFLQAFRNLFRVFQNLYVKLIAAAAIGVLLVAGMMLNEQLSSASVARSNEQSRNQNLVVKEVMLAQQSYLRGQIQRRNVVLARNLDDSKKAGAEALEHAKAAAERAVDADNRARLEQFSARLDEFMKISIDMANSHFEIVKLQHKQIDTIAKWNKAVETTMALPELKSNDKAAARAREAAAAMSDVSIAYWRYATLQEPVVLGKMYQAADKVYIELQRALSDTKDEKAQAAINALLELTSEMNDIIDGTKQSYDTYLKIEREKNTPLRAQLEKLIAEISTAADDIAHRADVSLQADMA